VSDVLDADRLLAFHEACGFDVYRGASGHWYEKVPRFLLAVPTHEPIRVEPGEVRAALRATGALGLRYVCADEDRGRESWMMVARGADYALDRLSGNNRSKVRRGLKNNTIRRISGEELIRCGEQAFLDTVGRQGRADRYGLDRWHRLLRAADREPGIEIWSAWHDDELAAYLLIMVFEDACEFYEARSRSDKLRYYPNNALVYTVTTDILVERRLPEINFGIEGLEDLPSLDEFKLAMGFERKPVRQHVVFHPAVRLALGPRVVRRALGALAHRSEGSGFWRRAEGLLTFADLEA